MKELAKWPDRVPDSEIDPRADTDYECARAEAAMERLRLILGALGKTEHTAYIKDDDCPVCVALAMIGELPPA